MTVFLKPYRNHLSVYEVWELCFAVMIVLITMKVAINNSILKWMGEHTFEIYILQRIPMRILESFGMNEYPYIMGMVTFIMVILIAFLFGKVLHIVDKRILTIFQKEKI